MRPFLAGVKVNEGGAGTLIGKKRDKKELASSEIKWLVDGLLKGEVADYQWTALLMAIYLHGLSKRETAALTEAILCSGTTLAFEGENVIDKHSTGGVGDKTSFIVAPLAAACGVKVPMIAGRGLAHTGGTIDKLESIPDLKTNLALDTFKRQVEREGLAIISQTDEIAPADRAIYALRSATGTAASIPLIVASIVSKKLAEGAKGIVMDVKVGNGAFMESLPEARLLALQLKESAEELGCKMMTVLSDMNQPLGKAVGNSLEIIESIETLKGKGPPDLTELSLNLAGAMLHLGGVVRTCKEGSEKARQALNGGRGLEKFGRMIAAQGGNANVIEDYSLLPLAKNVRPVLAREEGYLAGVNNCALGLYCVELGGGRRKQRGEIDPRVGMVFNKKIGEPVEVGECLAEIHYNDGQEEQVESTVRQLLERDLTVSSQRIDSIPPLIYQMDGKEGN